MSESQGKVEEFAAPLDGEDPCGPDLTYDPSFSELGRVAEGTPERVSGDEVIEAEPPDWYDVGERATELLARTRDLRVVVLLSRAWLSIEGLSGLASGLEIAARLCENHWDGVHPRADEDGDLVLRFNSLRMLADDTFLLGALRQAPLLYMRQYGSLSLRALRIASGRLKLTEDSQETPLDQGTLDAIGNEAPQDELDAVLGHARRAVEGLAALEAAIDARAAGYGPDFKPLQSDLKEILRHLEDCAARRAGEAVAEEGGEGDAAAGGGARAGGGAPGAIRSRQDVIKALDAICMFYRDAEPSSPVPILLNRAKRMVNRTFLEILRDMTPSGVSEAEVFVGQEEQSG
jgi:type VI secretion system protein ImpA